MISEINKKLAENAEKTFPKRKLVYGGGKINSDIMLIGEAPGGEEEKQGKPFVGSAGKNLNKFLEIIELDRENIYITNVVKIRPFKLSPKTNRPVNRPPNKEEIDFFKEYLYNEIEVVNPKIIVTLGNVALKTVLKNNKALIGDFHGKICNGNIFPLYHPASIIYNQKLKETYLSDLKKLKEILHS